MWNRIKALPSDAYLWRALHEADEQAEAEKQEAEIHDLLAPFRPPKEG